MLQKQHKESPGIPFTTTQLYDAAKAGDLASMQFLLNHGVDPNAPTTVEHAQPALFAAVVYQQRAALDLLLERGGKLETRNARGTTVLHSPAWQGNEELVRYLLSKGADPKAMATGLQETRGVRLPIGTPLHIVGFSGSSACGKALIEAGADVNAACPESGHTPLHMAARFDNHEFARLLLKNRARVDARYTGTHLAGTTPMHEAAAFGCTLTGFVLAEYGASLNTPLTAERPVTPLHLAVRGNHLGFVREIISRPIVKSGERPDFTAADELGDTALHIAARRGSETSVAFIRWMIAEGAPLDARNRSGLTPGELAASPQGRQDPDISAALRPLQPAVVMTDEERKGFEAVTRQLAQTDPAGRCSLLHAQCKDGLSAAVLLLLDAGVPVDGVMEKGRTPLMRAAAAGHVNVVRLLLSRGAAINAADEGGRTALHYAAQERKPAAVRFLLEKGALVNACAKGHIEDRGVWLAAGTPLHMAARWGALDICKLLMEHGADVNFSPPASGQTPLIAAARHGRTETVNALLAAGANLNATYSPKGDSNEAGSTALHNAAWFNCGDTAKALLKAGADINHRKIPGTNLFTPFMLLIRENHFELAHQLCTGTETQPAGARPDLTLTDSEGDTALHVAVRRYSKASPEFISWLITRGAALNAKNNAGLTAAELAADAKLGRPVPEILALMAHPPVAEKPE
jgi:ankyrin repeat protein